MYTKTEEADQKVIDRLGELAKKRNIPRATLATGLDAQQTLHHLPIVGATKPNHLTDAVAALSVKLTPDEITSLEEPYIPHPVLGFS